MNSDEFHFIICSFINKDGQYYAETELYKALSEKNNVMFRTVGPEASSAAIRGSDEAKAFTSAISYMQMYYFRRKAEQISAANTAT